MTKTTKPLLTTNISQLKLHNRGKVRDIYEVNNDLLIVTTDRISAFDVVLPNGIPYKGQVLTGLSEYWFHYTADVTENHLITADIDSIDNAFVKLHKDILHGRSMLVKKVNVIPVECIIRGYLAGSGWKEYQKFQSICGIKLPAGLKESDKLPEPIFTPSTKAHTGHDENIPVSEVINLIGKTLTDELKEKSLKIYSKASEYAKSRGIIICDTKFEWGVTNDNKTMLIDEVLTPDSSRFWPLEFYKPGKPQPSYDKQFIRDYLESIHWDKNPPAPALPPDIIQKTSEKYLNAYKTLTGKSLI
ncbi:MAG: phosphoribosylaminoimidazolesuccinocarboxamide synthase [Candidatus Kuenenia sp.]|nr:phosphoribosylaminoimidazolesuccinocarboxamide synthase [Candidatus Kuenenia sp.]